MDNCIIQVSHLSKTYKLYEKKSDRLKEAISISGKHDHSLFYALNDISFEVKRGETIGIIGTNGSGKSTLLKILTGVTAATEGSVQVQGKISALLELGAGFNPEYTGLENIALNGAMMGFSPEEMEARREEIVKFADIGDYINQPVKNYSSGMFARLAFAVAISIEPEILIVDEALSVGDIFFQGKCYRKFEELRSKGVSILFVSHDIPTVRRMCSKVLWIEQGVQKMFGASETVCNQYFNEQTRRMNEENLKILDELQNDQEEFEERGIRIKAPKVTAGADCMVSDKAEILSAYICNSRGEYVQHIKADEQYTIGIVTKFHEDMDNVIVGFVLTNKRGVIMLAENTYADGGASLHVSKDEILETRFSFVLPKFRSDLYEISPAVALGEQNNHVNLTWLHGVLSVELEREGYELAELGIPSTVNTRRIESVQLF